MVLTMLTGGIMGAPAAEAFLASDCGFPLSPQCGFDPLRPVRPAQAPVLEIGDAWLVEGNAGTRVMNFWIYLWGSPQSDVRVSYSTASGTATAPGDYTAKSGTVTFAGETAKTIAVTLVGETAQEPHEWFLVNLSSPSGAAIADGQGTGTILNDDGARTLSISDTSVAEGQGWAALSVFLSAVSTSPVSVSYATANGSATTPGDYGASKGRLNFAPGQASQTLWVPVVKDEIAEPDEALLVNLSSASGASIYDGQGRATIADDDRRVMQVMDASIVEGNSGTTVIKFVVRLSEASPAPVRARYEAVPGTAEAGPTNEAWGMGRDNTGLGDYRSTPWGQSVSFAPGETSKVASVEVNGDVVPELDEQFYLRLLNPEGARFARQGTGTIIDDDSPL